jgi:hypothetical protein
LPRVRPTSSSTAYEVQAKGLGSNLVYELKAVNVELKFVYENGGTRPPDIIYKVVDVSGNQIMHGLFGN